MCETPMYGIQMCKKLHIGGYHLGQLLYHRSDCGNAVQLILKPDDLHILIP